MYAKYIIRFEFFSFCLGYGFSHKSGVAINTEKDRKDTENDRKDTEKDRKDTKKDHNDTEKDTCTYLIPERRKVCFRVNP